MSSWLDRLFLFYHWIIFHCVNVTLCLFIHLLKDVLIVSRFWQLWIKLLWILMCRFFVCEHKFLINLGKYWGEKLLDRMVRVCLVLYETAKVSSRVTVRFTFSPAMNESSCSLLRLFDSSDPGGWEVVSQFCFDLHSLMANDVELFFHAILYWGNIGL